MRNETLPSPREMLSEAKREFGESFSDATVETCFVDAFENGEYHEEEDDWGAFSEKLSDVELASLFLPVCKALISGSVHNREGESLKTIMNCFATLGKWQQRHLKSPDEILSALSAVREILFREVLENRGFWWTSMLIQFKILEEGIRKRMGLHSMDTPYSDIEYKLSKSR